MGTSSFALPYLKRLTMEKYNIVAVYSQPPRRAGRGKRLQDGEVVSYAKTLGIPYFCPENFENLEDVEVLKNLKADFAVVVSYGIILPKVILDAPQKACLNVHASLLPRWRGAAPIQRALLSNDEETGISVIKMELGLDTGPIIVKEKIKIGMQDNFSSLHSKLSLLGARLIINVLDNYDNCNIRSQPVHGVTYARKIEKHETKIDWNNSADEIIQKIRAFSDSPGAWFELKGERIKVFDGKFIDGKAEPGRIVDSQLTIGCRDRLFLPLILQRAGRSQMDLKTFLRGFKIEPGTKAT